MSEAIYLAPGPDRYGFEHLKNLALGAISTFSAPARREESRPRALLWLCCSADQSGPVVPNVLNMTASGKRQMSAAEEEEEGGKKHTREGGASVFVVVL